MQDPRRLPGLRGATNFRDLGGYAGLDGRRLRWGRLFRSDQLADLTDTDHRTLRALGLARSVDFRGTQERAAQPYELPGVRQHSLAIEPTVAQDMAALVAAGQPLSPARMATLMEQLYRRLVSDASERFAQWFEHLLAEDTPLVFHCTAGKDRTGVAAALLLLALGVPRAVVQQDYLLTNQLYRRPADRGSGVPDAALAVLWSVQPRFLDTALDTIEREHGGLQRYLAQRMRLSRAAREQLATMYLEPRAA